MKKPKSAAKLAAEASDRLDALAETMRNEMDAHRVESSAKADKIREKYKGKRAAVMDALDELSLEKLNAIYRPVVMVVDPEELADELDTIPTDEPTHLRDVMP